MANKKQKYYVVWEGNDTGVFSSWNECQLQIKGYPNAKYKSFKTKAEANEAFANPYADYIGKTKSSKESKISEKEKSRIIWDSLSVDAACSGSPGIMEYQGVWTKNKERVFKMGPFPYGTNNIGEFLALVHGIAFLQKIDKPKMVIYSDSRTALSWVRNKKVKTTLVQNDITKDLYILLNRAEKWIRDNRFENPLIKWETEYWGEIPADFGRK